MLKTPDVYVCATTFLDILLSNLVLRVGVLALLKLWLVATGKVRVVLWGTWDLTSELLKSLALGLWDEESGEATEKHEEGEDLEDVVQPWVGVGGSGTAGTERSNGGLGNDRADLARGSGETVRSRPVASWETLARNDEGSSVRTYHKLVRVQRQWTQGNIPKLKKNWAMT